MYDFNANSSLTDSAFTREQRAVIQELKALHLHQQFMERYHLELNRNRARMTDATGQPLHAFLFAGKVEVPAIQALSVSHKRIICAVQTE